MDDLPPEFQADLAELELWSNDALRQQVFARFDVHDAGRHDQLLERQRTRTLTAPEQEELNELRIKADLLMFRKAYAALLLKWRGEHVPTVAELEAAA